MEVETLLADPPAIHVDARGNPLPWQADARVLRLIGEAVDERSHTLETGSGLSTLVFAVRGCTHTCVVPETEEVERILAWCEANGVATDRLSFEVRQSEDALPALDGTPLDLVFIDGGHGFPTPFIDWWYAGRRLRPGGLLVIDDTHLWTGRVLRDFLDEQPGWSPVARFAMRAAVFRRDEITDARLDGWTMQPYVARRSYHGGIRGAVRKAVRGGDLVRREGVSGLRARMRG